MSLYLDVPFVSQTRYGDGSMNDPTGCWYCSACMLAYHFEAGPRRGVPEIHGGTLTPAQRAVLATNGISIPSGHAEIGGNEAKWMLHAAGINFDWGGFDLLIQREGLEAVPSCATKSYSLGELEVILRKSGPIIFGWNKTAGGVTYGHLSVLIGVDDAKWEIIYHDPDNAPYSRMSPMDFDARLIRWEYALMRRKGVVSSNVRVKALGKKKFCYLTTACAVARGLPDDCVELTTLRRFRDGYVQGLPGGARLIDEYYRTAPLILERIGARPDAWEVLDQLYGVIVGCVRSIREGRNADALLAYRMMFESLAQQYLPERARPGRSSCRLASLPDEWHLASSSRTVRSGLRPSR